MISRLEYKLNFANGKTISQSLELGLGSTLITGQNGKGKSLNFEMVGYLLFGTQALRGVATDYKAMSVEGDFSIKGVEFTIRRTKSKAEVHQNGEMIVSGTKPVNEWVVRTLGYKYEVFRIAHWCAQGDIQALAEMKPTERKAMIDSVAGLNQLDGLTTVLSTRIRELKASIEAQERLLVEPVAPLAPEISRNDIQASVEEHEGYLNQWRQASAVSTPVEPTAPIKPEEPEYPPKPEAYTGPGEAPVAPVRPAELPENWQEVEQQLVPLIQQGRVLEANYAAAARQVDEAAAYPKGLESLEKLEAQWEGWKKRERLDQLLAHSQIECPNCQHHFHLDNSEIEALKKQKLPSKEPVITVSQWHQITKQLEANAQAELLEKQLLEYGLAEMIAAHGAIVDFKVAQKRYEEALAQHKRALASVELSNKQNLEAWDKRCTQIRAHYENQVRAYESQVANMSSMLNQYELAKQAWENAQRCKKTFTDKYGLDVEGALKNILTALRDELTKWHVYESKLQDYERAKVSYEEAQTLLEKERQAMAEYGRARDAIKEVKARVQSYLLPSLNKVASYLMAEMTGGEHQRVEVQSDFEVVVDGQPLRTLSGSGKDITNLALRIGLGRILTHKVLPMMMLDEIDAAMDESRAQYTWQCIQKVTPQIGQVLQASHKELAAQNRVVV